MLLRVRRNGLVSGGGPTSNRRYSLLGSSKPVRAILGESSSAGRQYLHYYDTWTDTLPGSLEEIGEDPLVNKACGPAGRSVACDPAAAVRLGRLGSGPHATTSVACGPGTATRFEPIVSSRVPQGPRPRPITKESNCILSVHDQPVGRTVTLGKHRMKAEERHPTEDRQMQSGQAVAILCRLAAKNARTL